jgi:hypothetical protein
MTAANIVLDVVATIQFTNDALDAQVSPTEHSISREWRFLIGHRKIYTYIFILSNDKTDFILREYEVVNWYGLI